MWPDTIGTGQKSICNSLVEMQKSPFLLKTDLEKGHAPAELAKRYSLPFSWGDCLRAVAGLWSVDLSFRERSGVHLRLPVSPAGEVLPSLQKVIIVDHGT